MKKVTRDEFYEAINTGRLNVSPSIVSDKYPYTSEWKYLDYGRHGQVFGKTVDVYTNGKNGLTHAEYYLNVSD